MSKMLTDLDEDQDKALLNELELFADGVILKRLKAEIAEVDALEEKALQENFADFAAKAPETIYAEHTKVLARKHARAKIIELLEGFGREFNAVGGDSVVS